MKHFVMHDLLHGVWHLEKGILFTLKETIIRPGQAALDYIKGKRVVITMFSIWHFWSLV